MVEHPKSSQDQRAEQNTVVGYDDSAPFSSAKIREKSARILSAAITIDGCPGAWSDAFAPKGLGVP